MYLQNSDSTDVVRVQARPIFRSQPVHAVHVVQKESQSRGKIMELKVPLVKWAFEHIGFRAENPKRNASNKPRIIPTN